MLRADAEDALEGGASAAGLVDKETESAAAGDGEASLFASAAGQREGCCMAAALDEGHAGPAALTGVVVKKRHDCVAGLCTLG